MSSDTTRAFVTPEGVDLRLRIAGGGQRLGAFIIDGLIIIGVLVGLTLLALAAGILSRNQQGLEVVAIIWLLIAFLLRNFYFTGFELTEAGATPGKRAMGLRVAARDGGRLRAESVVVRNAMRELELFLPMGVVLLRAQEGGASAWMYLLAVMWGSVLALFPLFNRDRLRLGDLVGGTWVVRAPRQALARDMADEGSERLARYAFTPQQLDAYGEKELHVLEDVVRQRDRRTVRAVAERISAKIGWPANTIQDDYDFLSAYYAALRGRLEGRLLMGRRRADKYAA